MTRDELIRMAREVGLWPAVTDNFSKELERFAEMVAAAEREACAKLMERDDSMRWSGAADAIRARGEK